MSSGKTMGSSLVSKCQQPRAGPDRQGISTDHMQLATAGRLLESDRPPAPHQQEIHALCRYMELDWGLSPATIATQRHYLKKFFKHTKEKQLGQLRITDVERFLCLALAMPYQCKVGVAEQYSW